MPREGMSLSGKIAIVAGVLWLAAPLVASVPVHGQETRVCSLDPIVWCQVDATTYPFIGLGFILLVTGFAAMAGAVYSGFRERKAKRERPAPP
jgi:hypothetical protein